METEKEIRQAALNALARREYSSHELRQKLLTKGARLDMLEGIITRLQEQSLLCDRRFTENFITMRVRRGYGPIRIEAELRQRGINDNTINDGLGVYKTRWVEMAKMQWQKHFNDTVGETYEEQAKHARYLQSRGYTNEHVAFVFDNVKS